MKKIMTQEEISKEVLRIINYLKSINLGEILLEKFFQKKLSTRISVDKDDLDIKRTMESLDPPKSKALVNEIWKEVMSLANVNFAYFNTQPTRLILEIVDVFKQQARKAKREWPNNEENFDVEKDILNSEASVDEAIAKEYINEITFIKAVENKNHTEAQDLLKIIAIMRKNLDRESVEYIELQNWKTELSVEMGDIQEFLKIFYETAKLQSSAINLECLENFLGRLVYNSMGLNIICEVSPSFIIKMKGNISDIRSAVEEQTRALSFTAIKFLAQHLIDEPNNLSEEDFRQSVRECFTKTINMEKFSSKSFIIFNISYKK